MSRIVERPVRFTAANNMVIAAVTLVLAGLLLIGLQFAAVRRQLAEDTEALSRMTGINAAAAVVFADQNAATETLATLNVVPNLRSAAIYGADGSLFASYVRTGWVAKVSADAASALPATDMGLFELRVVDVIRLEDQPVGTVVLRIGLQRMYLRLAAFALMFVAAAVLALGMAYPLVSRMRAQVARASQMIRDQASLLDKAQDAIIVMALNLRVIYWNSSAERLYQWSPEEAAGRTVDDLLGGDRAAFDAATSEVCERGEWRGELLHHRKDGSMVTVEGHWTLVRDDDGRPKSILAIETDISARKRAEARVSRLSRLRAVLGGISSAVLRVRERDELLFAACRVAVIDGVFALAWAGILDPETGEGKVSAWFGDGSDYLQSIRFSSDLSAPGSEHPASRAAREQRLIVCNDIVAEPGLESMRGALLKHNHRSLAAFPLIVEGRPVAVLVLCANEADFFDDEEVSLLEWLRADLSYALEHLEKARQLNYLAYYDALTGLPNSTLFRDRLGQFLLGSTSDSGVCVVLVDIEHFTGINDTLGRDTGDAVLRAIGERLRDRLTEPFTVARISADTFAIANTCSLDDCAVQLRDQVFEAVREPIHVRNRELHIGLQVGIALYPTDGADAETLFKNAEAALKEAKATNQRAVYYAAAMNASMAERMTLESELRAAVEHGQFVMHYQPRVDLQSGWIVGAEALIRWQHPDGELLGPDRFIALAEQTGLIVAIGDWVLNTVCRQQAAWRSQGFTIVPVGVNLSPVQFRRADMFDSVRSALEESGLEGKYLELELTESTAMEKPEEAARTLQALRGLGVRISLDDFGTGFSSLAHLKRFPLTAVKIDRTFVRDITRSPDDAAIANAVIALAHGMSLRVVAEGVETKAQLNYLRSKHCDEIQGHVFSAALSPVDFVGLLRGGMALEFPPSDVVAVGTLLIVDDEPSIRSALTRAVRRDGYEILTAGSGAEALELLALHPVQVIISDQRMPGMSGTEFLEVVRQLYPETIRIILSGYTDLKVVTDGVNRGAIYKFLTKPWDDDEVREQIRVAFRNISTRRNAPVSVPALDGPTANTRPVLRSVS